MSLSDMGAGAAGEHIACADLILLGHTTCLAAAGLPYDLIVDVEGRLIRIQVKSTREQNIRGIYRWHVYARRGGAAKARIVGADLVALVALDSRVVAYLPAPHCGMIVDLLPPGCPTPPQKNGHWIRRMEACTFEAALNGETPLVRSSPGRSLLRGPQR